MTTPIQLTITLDANGAIASVKNLEGQAVGSLGRIQSSVVKVGQAGTTAFSGWTSSTATSWAGQIVSGGKKAEEAFNGIESAERRAHIAGQLFTRTTGIEMPRALETVISRSQVLGPILESMFGVAVFAAAVPAVMAIGEGIISITEDMAGYTDEVKKMEQETIQASRQSFVNPSTLAIVKSHLDQINAEIEQATKQREALEQSGPSVGAQIAGAVIPGLDIAMIVAQERQRNEAVKQGIELDNQRIALQERDTELQKQITDQVRAANEAAALAGLSGYARLATERAQQIANIRRDEKLNNDQKNQLIEDADRESWGKSVELARQGAQEVMALRHQVAEDAVTGAARIYQTEADKIEEIDARQVQSLISEKTAQQERVLIHQQAAQQIATFEKGLHDQTVSLQNQAALSAVIGDDRIRLSGQQRIDAIRQAEKEAQLELIKDPAERARLEGYYDAMIVAINKDTDNQVLQSAQATEQKRQQIMEQAAEDQKNAEQTIALATVNEWTRTYAQVQIEAQNKIAAIDKAERNALKDYQQTDAEYVAIEQAVQAKREAVWIETNQKILEEHKKQVEQLGADLESVFDDIGSGNIGQRILNNMKKLFFQILAEWLMTSQQMSSGFGSLFGNLVFGPGSTGANFFGGGAGAGGAGILGGIFGASSSAGTTPFLPGGASSGSTASFMGGFFPGTASTGIVPAGGFGPLVTGDTSGASAGGSNGTFLDSLLSNTASSGVSALFGGSAANALTTQSAGMFSSGGMLLGAGAPGALAPPTLGNTLGGITSSLFNMKSLPGLASLGLMLGGSKLGGVGQIGAMISSLAIMASASQGGVAASMLAQLGPAAGLVGTLLPLIGEGLLGFGVGMQTGPVLGSIVGGAAGAGIGFLTAALAGFGGPVGAAIGAIIGALSGLFGGLFGGGKRKKAANNYFDQQIAPGIKQIEDEFKSFQLDYATANSQLESLRSQAKDQLSKLKGEGKSVFKDKVSPAIDEAEKEISQFETERERRSGLVFGPPQFHSGGYVEAATSAWTTKPGEMLALLKRGEFVMDPVATASNRPLLERLNSGQQIGNTHTVVHGSGGLTVSGGLTLNLNPAQLDRNYVKSEQFMNDVLAALTQAANLGRRG